MSAVNPDFSPLGSFVGQHNLCIFSPTCGNAVCLEQRKFGQDKLDSLPRYCRKCEVLFACHGECPRNRFTTTPDGEPRSAAKGGAQ